MLSSLSCNSSDEHRVGGLELAGKMLKWKYTHDKKYLDSHYITFLPTESFNGAHGGF
jgi:hypothetical protein